ncbi:MAG: helix-turn-helix domain-containing protein, partial [Thiohalomonadales bacterium]
MTYRSNKVTVIKGSRNIFYDIGIKKPDELKVKAQIAVTINSIVKHRHITQKEAAGVLGITQPQVSDLNKGKLKHFSIERLFEFLNALGRDVEIVIKKKNTRSRRDAVTQVVA